LFWVILIAALATAITLAARYQPGYVLIVVPPYRVELSLGLLVVLLVLAFVACYFATRIIVRATRLPSEVKEYRSRRRIERAHRNLAGALRAYFEGRYATAEKAASELIDTGEFKAIAAVVAARAAHEQRAYERRDHFLARTAYYGEEDQTMRAIVQAELLLHEREPQLALAALERLPNKHIAALRLELKAVQLARNWDRYLEILSQLARAQALEENQAEELRRYGLAQNLARKSHDPAELSAYWQRLGPAERRDPMIAAAAARAFAQSGLHAEAQAVIETALDAGWDSVLVALYGDVQGEDTRQIEHAERWLATHPSDAALLLALGRLCARRQLWGKAKSYLEASLSVEASSAAHLQLAQLLEQTGDADAARAHYSQSLELAAHSQSSRVRGENSGNPERRMLARPAGV
jgi:HemY protein